MAPVKAALALFLMCSMILHRCDAAADQQQQQQQQQSDDLPPPPASCDAKLRSEIIWGGATSAYQIEGAWDADGKGPSIWDTFTHKGGEVIGNATGDVAIDHYHRWREDVAMMKKLGVKTYRFSVAWTRIVPSGLRGSPVNAAGVKFYKDLITELLYAGIVPAITLYHWDLPQALQDKTGGFLANGTAFIDAFEYYADVAFREFGPLVKLWMTFNEPLSICQLGYGEGVFAPGVKGGVAGQYKCGHNVLLAHARAYHLYQRKYAAAQGGKISIPLDGKWGDPYDPNSAADKEAADLWMQYQYGWMADPLYFGDYPASMRNGTTGALLPRFTAEESAALKGAIDYFAVQFYCGYFIRAAPPGSELPFIVEYKGPDGKWVGPPSAAKWLFTTPTGLRKTLVWLDRRYSVDGRKVEFTISENGVAGPGENTTPLPAVLKDTYRLNYYTGYLDNLCKAITEDGVKFTTYWAWSLFDNFEWRQAYTEHFGLVYVDYQNNLTRTPKDSAHWFARYMFEPSKRFNDSYYKGLWRSAPAAKPQASSAARPKPLFLF